MAWSLSGEGVWDGTGVGVWLGCLRRGGGGSGGGVFFYNLIVCDSRAVCCQCTNRRGPARVAAGRARRRFIAERKRLSSAVRPSVVSLARAMTSAERTARIARGLAHRGPPRTSDPAGLKAGSSRAGRRVGSMEVEASGAATRRDREA